MKRYFRGKYFFLLFCIYFIFPGIKIASPAENIRIRILSRFSPDSIIIRAPEGNLFFDGKSISARNPSISIKIKNNNLFIHGKDLKTHQASSIYFSSPENFTVSFLHRGHSEYRKYTGALTVLPDKKHLIIVNSLHLENYIHAAAIAELGILLRSSGGTCSRGWRSELVSAMEIAIRSYILHMKNRHKDPRYHFCDLTHCIHFPGIGNLRKEDIHAVTRGTVILNDSGKPHAAFFHAASGGTLTGPEVFWPLNRQESHFRRGSDCLEDNIPLSSKSPHESWSTKIRPALLKKIFQTPPVMDVQLRLRQNRVTEILLVTSRGAIKIPVALFMSRMGKNLGWNKIKSNSFTVTRKKDSFVFTGRGLGHGIGMSQWSARELACRGWSRKQILSYFYNNPEIVLWPR